MQLSAKALLKPFNTVTPSSQDDNGGNDSDMPDLAPLDEDEGDGGDNAPKDDDNGNDDDDNDDDPLATLSDEEREQLMENTEAIHTTLNKVCINYFIYIVVVTLISLHRSASFCLPLSTRLPLPSLPGVKLVLLILSVHASSPMTLKPDGILHMTC